MRVATWKNQIFVADPYNNKIKVLSFYLGSRMFAGTAKQGDSGEPARFDEPAGLSVASNTLFVADINNHAIHKIELETGATTTLALRGLTPPEISTSK